MRQLFNDVGLLLSYSVKFGIPVISKEYVVVIHVIPSGVIMLLKDAIKGHV